MEVTHHKKLHSIPARWAVAGLFVLGILFGTMDLAAGEMPGETRRDKDGQPALTEILKLAQESLESQNVQDSYRFGVSPRWVPGSLAAMPKDAIIDVVIQGSVERFTNFEVTYLSGSRRRQAQVQLQVDMEHLVPVVRERLDAGKEVRRDHLDQRWVPVPRDRGQLVTDPAEIEGKTIRRTLASGEPIRRADISTEYVVEAGDAVTLTFRNDGMSIELIVVARQNGSVEDDIRLYSDETRRTYLGTVTGPGSVDWKRTL